MCVELKPCPFCGEVLQINNANLAVHSGDSDCLLRQQPVVVDDPKQVERWNRRALPAGVDGIEVVGYRVSMPGEPELGTWLDEQAECEPQIQHYEPLMLVAQHLAALASLASEMDALKKDRSACWAEFRALVRSSGETARYLHAEIERYQAAMAEVIRQVDGNIRATVRDCVNGRPDVQDIYGYCDLIEGAINAVLPSSAGSASTRQPTPAAGGSA